VRDPPRCHILTSSNGSSCRNRTLPSTTTTRVDLRSLPMDGIPLPACLSLPSLTFPVVLIDAAVPGVAVLLG
jgi:hypothetical protein